MSEGGTDSIHDDDRGPGRWRTIALFVLTATTIVGCMFFLNTLLFSIVGAITLAVVTQPLADLLRRRIGSTWTATLLVIAISIALLLPLFFIMRNLISEAMVAVAYVQNGSAAESLHRIASNHPKVGGWLQKGIDHLTPGDTGRQIAGWAAPTLGRGLQALVSGVTDGVLLLFFYFFLVRDQKKAVGTLQSLLPLRSGEIHDFVHRMAEVIQAIFAGRVLIAVIQGTLAGLAYWLLGVPAALLWGSITVVCCLVPAFGSFVAWIPIAIYLGLAQSWIKAGILAAWGGVVIANLDNFLYPVLVGKKADLHTAVIFVAIFGGLAVFGISGFVLGPMLIAAAMLLLQFWKERTSGTSPF